MAIDLKNITETKSGTDTQQTFLQKAGTFFTRDIRLFGTGLNHKKKEKFFSDISLLLSSGIDIKTAFEIIIDEEQKDKDLYQHVLNDIVSGKSLSEALKRTQKFGAYDYYSIRIGEETGMLNDVLQELSKFYQAKIKQTRQMTGAFTYPAVVLVTAIAAIAFMTSFIVPMFIDIFNRTNNELPPLTRYVVNISGMISSSIIYIVLLVLLIIILFMVFKEKPVVKKLKGIMISGIPFIGKITKMSHLSRFYQTMGLLIKSKVTLLKAIEMTENMTTFYMLNEALKTMREEIARGKLLYESMAVRKIFDKRTVSLVKVGEEVNKLDDVFQKLYDQLNAKIEHRLNMMNTLIEPVLIIGIGFLVGVILIAMYLPMFKMGTAIY